MEAKEQTSLGESLHVPCVQELAKQNSSTVPLRYVRPDQEPPTISDTYSLPQVPVIDMQKLLARYECVMNLELEKFHNTCKDWGFFQLINHEVMVDLVERVKEESQEFFNMSMDEKKKLWQQPGEMEGFGQHFVISEEQKLDWADLFYLTTLPTHLRNPHLFSKLPLPFRKTVETYSAELRLLSLKLLNTMAKTLKIEVEDMQQLFEEGLQGMRMNYYPSCPQPELVIGLNPHSDACGLTILLQINEMEGLQIKKDGMWIPVKPLPNAFVVNIGDALEVAGSISSSYGRKKEDEGDEENMEAKEQTSLGESLHVPCVQELAKQNSSTVPLRYVRPDQEPPTISDTYSLPQVPVIDMQKLLARDECVMNLELEKFHNACKDWGFFQLINHEVMVDLVERVKEESQEFFNMSMDEKKKLWQQPGEMEGFGQHFVISEEQKLDWADLFYLTTLPTHLRNPHLFSKLPLPFRKTVETYSAELRLLSLKLLNTMAKTLKIEVEDMQQLFEEGLQGMRMNYYPPCPQPELVIGLNPHSDACGLTILLQINEMEGLQIKKDGMWIPVKPLPNAFVVNIGDALEIITNGNYRSIEHRATVNLEKERLSIATFYSPKLDGDLGPAPTLIMSNPPLFRRLGVADYFQAYFSQELKGKSFIDTMRV